MRIPLPAAPARRRPPGAWEETGSALGRNWIRPGKKLNPPWEKIGSAPGRNWIRPGKKLDQPREEIGSALGRNWISPGKKLDQPWEKLDRGSNFLKNGSNL